LTQAKLMGADLSGADLLNASPSKLDLNGVKTLGTTLPDGSQGK
jgi:uncharacterized protein YjbI with pentapeptide repeats